MQAISYISNFKKIIGIILFVSIVLLSILLIGKYYEAKSKTNIIEQYLVKRFEEFYNLPKNTLDLVFIGSSHSYTTFDPDIFDSRLNIKSFQMGAPSQQADSTYFELREILNYQKPKVVVYEYYWTILGSDKEEAQARTLFELLKSEDLKKEFANELFSASDGDLAKYHIKSIRFQQNYFAYMSNIISTAISDYKNMQNKNGVEYYRSKGFVYCDRVIPIEEFDEENHFKSVDGTDFIFDEYQKGYIKKIIDLCRSEGIELIFVTAPLANVTMEFIKNYDKIHEEMSLFANQNKINYIDYNIVNKQQKILQNENFQDDNHLNYSGAVIVSNHFIDWLLKLCDTV